VQRACNARATRVVTLAAGELDATSKNNLRIQSDCLENKAYVEPGINSLVQSEKTYCAAFCASLALLAGSGNNEGRDGGKKGGLLIRSARMSFG